MTEAPDELPMDPDDFGVTRSGGVILQDDEGDGPPTDLDERMQQTFVGLMYLGYIEDTCQVAGHQFRIRTPDNDERIERGELHRRYIGSMNFDPMWELITVAAYCTAIDDVPAPEPLSPKIGPVATRLRWIKDHIISRLVISKIFEQCLLVDARERAVVEYLDEQSKS